MFKQWSQAKAFISCFYKQINSGEVRAFAVIELIRFSIVGSVVFSETSMYSIFVVGEMEILPSFFAGARNNEHAQFV